MSRFAAPTDENNRPLTGILFIMFGMALITANDVLVKFLSGGYPLHQVIFIRSVVGIAISLVLVQMEGGFQILKTRRPALHMARASLLVLANLCFFMALAAMPLAEATAIFFVAPLFMTVLSFLILHEPVGIRRVAAILVGFAGVLVMLRPWDAAGEGPGLLVSLLPMGAAATFALFNILTRKLGGETKASAMAIYAQSLFLVVGAGFYLVAGDGRFAEGTDNPSLVFLLRAWVWPSPQDWVLIITLGVISGGAAYSLSQAYRSAPAGTVAPFEYVALPLSVVWGYVVFGELVDPDGAFGMILILGSGLYVFWREQRLKRAASA